MLLGSLCSAVDSRLRSSEPYTAVFDVDSDEIGFLEQVEVGAIQRDLARSFLH